MSKKMSKTELQQAKQAAKIRAPLFSLLTRRLQFTRIDRDANTPLYRCDSGSRLFVISINDKDGLVSGCNSDNQLGEHVACTFKLTKEDLLLALASVATSPLKPTKQPVPQPQQQPREIPVQIDPPAPAFKPDPVTAADVAELTKVSAPAAPAPAVVPPWVQPEPQPAPAPVTPQTFVEKTAAVPPPWKTPPADAWK